MGLQTRNELIKEIEKYTALNKSLREKIKNLQQENKILVSKANDFITNKVDNLSETLAKHAGSFLDSILS